MAVQSGIRETARKKHADRTGNRERAQKLEEVRSFLASSSAERGSLVSEGRGRSRKKSDRRIRKTGPKVSRLSGHFSDTATGVSSATGSSGVTSAAQSASFARRRSGGKGRSRGTGKHSKTTKKAATESTSMSTAETSTKSSTHTRSSTLTAIRPPRQSTRSKSPMGRVSSAKIGSSRPRKEVRQGSSSRSHSHSLADSSDDHHSHILNAEDDSAGVPFLKTPSERSHSAGSVKRSGSSGRGRRLRIGQTSRRGLWNSSSTVPGSSSLIGSKGTAPTLATAGSKEECSPLIEVAESERFSSIAGDLVSARSPSSAAPSDPESDESQSPEGEAGVRSSEDSSGEETSSDSDGSLSDNSLSQRTRSQSDKQSSEEIMYFDGSTSRRSHSESCDLAAQIYDDVPPAALETLPLKPDQREATLKAKEGTSEKDKKNGRSKKKKRRKKKKKKKDDSKQERKNQPKVSDQMNPGMIPSHSKDGLKDVSEGVHQRVEEEHEQESVISEQTTELLENAPIPPESAGLLRSTMVSSSGIPTRPVSFTIDPSKLPDDPNSSIKDSETRNILLAAAAAADIAALDSGSSSRGKRSRGSQVMEERDSMERDEQKQAMWIPPKKRRTTQELMFIEKPESTSSIASDMLFAKEKPLPNSPDALPFIPTVVPPRVAVQMTAVNPAALTVPNPAVNLPANNTGMNTRHTSTEVRPPTPEIMNAVEKATVPISVYRNQAGVRRSNDYAGSSSASSNVVSVHSYSTCNVGLESYRLSDTMHDYTAYHSRCVVHPRLNEPRTYFLCELMNTSMSVRQTSAVGTYGTSMMHSHQRPLMKQPSLDRSSVFDRYFAIESYSKNHVNHGWTGVPPIKTNETVHGSFSFISAIPRSMGVSRMDFSLVSMEDNNSVFTLQECNPATFVLYGIPADCAAELVHRYGKSAKELEFFTYFSSQNCRPIPRCGNHGRARPPLRLETLAEIRRSLSNKMNCDVSTVSCDRCRCTYASDSAILYSCALGGGSKCHPHGRHYCVDCVNYEMNSYLSNQGGINEDSNDRRIVIEEPSLTGPVTDYSMSFVSDYLGSTEMGNGGGLIGGGHAMVVEERDFKSDWIDFLPRDGYLRKTGISEVNERFHYGDSIAESMRIDGCYGCTDQDSHHDGLGSEYSHSYHHTLPSKSLSSDPPWICVLKFKRNIDYRPMERKIQMSALHLKYCFFPDIPCRVEVFGSPSSGVCDEIIERRFHLTEWLLCWLFSLPIAQLFGSVIRTSHNTGEERFERSLSINLSLGFARIRRLLWDPIHVALVAPSKKGASEKNGVGSTLRTKKSTGSKCAYFLSQMLYSTLIHALWMSALIPIVYPGMDHSHRGNTLQFGVLCWFSANIALFSMWCSLEYSVATPQELRLFPLSVSLEVDLEWTKKMGRARANSLDFYRSYTMFDALIMTVPLRSLMEDLRMLCTRKVPKEFPISVDCLFGDPSWLTVIEYFGSWVTMVGCFVLSGLFGQEYHSAGSLIHISCAIFGILANSLVLIAVCATLLGRGKAMVCELKWMANLIERHACGLYIDLQRCPSNSDCLLEMNRFLARKFQLVLSSMEIPLMFLIIMSSLCGALFIATLTISIRGNSNTQDPLKSLMRSDLITLGVIFFWTIVYLGQFYFEFVNRVRCTIDNIRRRIAHQLEINNVDCVAVKQQSYECVFFGLNPLALTYLWLLGLIGGAVFGSLLSSSVHRLSVF